MKSGLTKKQWDTILSASNDPNQFVRVARINNEPVGIVLAAIKEDEWLDCIVGYLYWISVDPSLTNQGIATNLLNAVEEWFKIKGVKGKSLNVSANNAAAIDLYRKFGYEIIDYRMLGRG